MKENSMIRNTAKKKGVYLYMIADRLGISEPQFIRWLRKPLPDEKRTMVMEIIDELSEVVNV